MDQAAQVPRSRTLLPKLLAVVVVALGLGLAYRFGVFSQLADPKSFSRAVLELGAWGYLWFVLAYALLQPFGVPGTVFVVAAPLIWPWPIAFALSMTGTMAASLVGFSYARFIARDWISARIPERFRKYNAALERNGFRTVFALRLIFWMPQVLHSFFGVSGVRFSTHFWGSLFGYIPPLLVVSYFASEVFDASGNMQPKAWTILGALVVASLALLLAMRWFDKRNLSPEQP